MKVVDAILPNRSAQPAVPLRQQIRFSVAHMLHASGLMRLTFRLLRRIDPTRRLVVLIYHKVVPAQVSGSVEGVASESLESHVRVMQELFECLPAEEATAALDSKAALSDRYPLLFTFDDGYQNNLQFALPVLSAWKVPSIVFAPTGLVGTQEFLWTDEVTELFLQSPRTELRLHVEGREECFLLSDRRSRLAAASTLKRRMKRMPYNEFLSTLMHLRQRAAVDALRHHDGTRLLTWESLQRLPSYGSSVGSHSSLHMVLANLPSDLLDADLAASQQQLEQRLGYRTRYIAYPNGHESDYNEQVFTSARKTGIVYGFTMRPGIAKESDDPMQLPRIVAEDEPGAMVALQVLRRLVSDVALEQLRKMRGRASTDTRTPPRLVVVAGTAANEDGDVEQKQVAPNPERSSPEVGPSPTPAEAETA